ncbi:MAG TPA: DNA polymerase I [Pirellulales bacterium]|jgi:DNA polymerase-1|nr:DNA polymerase I [Pirellulales bacterium]
MTRQSMFPSMQDDRQPKAAPATAAQERAAPAVDGPAPLVDPAPVTSSAETASAGEPTTLAGKTVWVVDANSLIFQVFHAIPEMTSPRGEPVAAVYGFTRDLLFLIDEKKPDYLFAAFDRPEPTFRHALFADYKGQRSEMPLDLRPQFPAIQRMLAAMGIASLELASYEADDILATIAHRTDELGGECFLVTADKDCRQLISPRVKIFNVRKNQVYDAAALLADWGVRPEQVVDFQALVGDSVDNIRGVPLVGPKVAREWLDKFGSLDELLRRAAELPAGKRKQNLIDAGQTVFVSRRLVALERHVPMVIGWQAGRVGGRGNGRQLAELCTEFGFRGLAAKLARLVGPAAPADPLPASAAGVAETDTAAESQASESTSAVPAMSEPAEADWTVNYLAVDTPEKLTEFVARLRKEPVIAFDTETTHIWPNWAELVGCSFCWQAGEAYYLPLRAPAGEPHLDPQAALEALRDVLENPLVKKVGQNLKYDMIVLRSAGIKLAGASFDTMIASYLLDAGERNHNLDELSKRYLHHTTTKISELIGSGKNQKRMDEVPVAAVTHYAAEDADVTWRLRPILEARLRESGLLELFDKVEIPLVDVLVEMESNGITIDVDRLAALSTRYAELLVDVEQQIYTLAGRPLNIGSPKQLQQVLFVEQKLPMLKKTKTGGSTDVEVLEELARQHPLPAKIIEYRQYAKLKNTYIDALPQLIAPRSGRVHTSFNQVVAATGRLSSNDPNLQNIPVRGASGREIRAAFLPGPPGWSLLAADYSQIELRVLAHFSQDPELLAAFARDDDIHALVASQVYGVPLTDVTEEMRRAAKAVNFGVIYGQSPFGLAKQLDIAAAEAARFIDAYFDRYRGVEEFLLEILEQGLRNGYVSTVLGRRRAISGIRSLAARQTTGRNEVDRRRNLPERTAINTVIQGSAADLIKLAMIQVQQSLASGGFEARLLLQIHDELVFEVPSAEIDTLARLVATRMSTAYPLAVPLKVDVKVGANWAAVKPWSAN